MKKNKRKIVVHHKGDPDPGSIPGSMCNERSVYIASDGIDGGYVVLGKEVKTHHRFGPVPNYGDVNTAPGQCDLCKRRIVEHDKMVFTTCGWACREYCLQLCAVHPIRVIKKSVIGKKVYLNGKTGDVSLRSGVRGDPSRTVVGHVIGFDEFNSKYHIRVFRQTLVGSSFVELRDVVINK